MNKYEFVVEGVCPVNGALDVYSVTVESQSMIEVGEMLKKSKKILETPIFQEDFARSLCSELGEVRVKVQGRHLGVLVTSTVGGV